MKKVVSLKHSIKRNIKRIVRCKRRLRKTKSKKTRVRLVRRIRKCKRRMIRKRVIEKKQKIVLKARTLATKCKGRACRRKCR